MRFLIVEDHVGMADQLSRGFCDRGLNARVVGDGEEALFTAVQLKVAALHMESGCCMSTTHSSQKHPRY